VWASTTRPSSGFAESNAAIREDTLALNDDGLIREFIAGGNIDHGDVSDRDRFRTRSLPR